MFTRQTDGSKIAIALLAAQLRRWGLPWIDCQMRTSHLVSLGAVEIARRDFVARVRTLVRETPVPAPWLPDPDLKTTFE
jgi:leucyl/phenylalanyl-tRNA---protein transferase